MISILQSFVYLEKSVSCVPFNVIVIHTQNRLDKTIISNVTGVKKIHLNVTTDNCLRDMGCPSKHLRKVRSSSRYHPFNLTINKF